MRRRQSHGRRRPERKAVTLNELRAERRSRALEEPLDVRVEIGWPFAAAEVRNPKRRTHYRVYFPAYPSQEAGLCTCPDFARRGIGTCKHLEAAWIYLKDHPPEPPAETPGTRAGVERIWKTIDMRMKYRPGRDVPASVSVRHPGRALIDFLGET